MSLFIGRVRLRAVGACALLAFGLALTGCDGPPAPGQHIDLVLAAADAATPTDVGQPTTVSFTLTNPTARTVDGVQTHASGSVNGVQVMSVSCTAQAATCPEIADTLIQPFSMPAGASLTFVVDIVPVAPTEGDSPIIFSVSSTARAGALFATAHATAVDGRDGYYLVFGASGLRTNLVVHFKPGAMSFSVSSGSVDKTMTPLNGYYTFPSGGHLMSATDLLAGQADFGHGLETFIAARNLVDSLSDLDGASFSTFNVTQGAGASDSDPVTGAVGPLDIWQVAVAGTTMTICTDTIVTIAGCAANHLRHYVMTSDGSVVFTATDSADNDTFTFEVARSGSSLILLRADVAPQDHLFTVGFANAQATTTEHVAFGNTGGAFGLLDLTAATSQFSAIDATGNTSPLSSAVTFGLTADVIPGLVHGTRPTDGAEVFVLQQGALVAAGTASGELGILVDLGH